jgi:large subunit ribosomal protein L9
MRVVLRSDVAGVGRRGDIVAVADGFARNYLLPEGRAIVATDGVEAQAGSMRRGRDLREAADRQAAEAKASVLAGAVLSVQARAGSGGRLFGSVTAADVVEAARAQKGVEIDRRHVALDEPIKTVGSFDIPLRLFEDVSTVVTLEVAAAA